MIPRRTGRPTGNTSAIIVRKFLMENPTATREEIAERFNLSLNTVYKYRRDAGLVASRFPVTPDYIDLSLAEGNFNIDEEAELAGYM